MADIALVSRLHRSLVLTSTDNERPGERALQDSVSLIHSFMFGGCAHSSISNAKMTKLVPHPRRLAHSTNRQRTNGRTDERTTMKTDESRRRRSGVGGAVRERDAVSARGPVSSSRNRSLFAPRSRRRRRLRTGRASTRRDARDWIFWRQTSIERRCRR